MSLQPPEKLVKLRTALHAKAKAAPTYRFYLLYDKLYRWDVLVFAYERCRANKGVPGVDGQSFQDIKEYGEKRWLEELAKELQDKTYQPSPVKRVWIPKPDGKQRPLGVPTIRDRVVQMAAVLVLEPIFEADLPTEQHAYRSGKSALDAIVKVQGLLEEGYTDVVDADLSGYFDSIPHAELMKSVARRISDGSLLHLIKMWLVAPVEETDEQGRKHRTTRNKDEGKGTPQGGVASPLLANLYMRRFIMGWKLNHEQRLQAYIVNYADDFVICTRGRAEEAMAAMRDMMSRLRLKVNEQKTRRCQLPEGTFTFLGKIRKLCQSISEETDHRTCSQGTEEKVRKLNQKLNGWANYFSLGPVVRVYEIVMKHSRRRLRRWLSHKHKVRTREYAHFPNKFLHDQLGLSELGAKGHSLLWAKA
jgi:RNA-directed DNA polymerase